MFKIYISLVFLVIRIFVNIHKYKSFLQRPHRLGSPANKTIYRQLNRRFMLERKGESIMHRDDLIVYLLGVGYEEEDSLKFKEELELPIILLALWYCEPVSQSEQKK